MRKNNNMLTSLKSLFSRSSPQKSEDSTEKAREKGKEFEKEIEKIVSFLKLEMPKIYMYPYLFSDEEHGQGGCPEKAVEEGTIPITSLVGGITYADRNTILLGYLDPLTKKPYDKKQIIVHFLHEIRHIWQFKYHYKQYYSEKNAIGEEEHISDISEIDADAFSLAYSLTILNYENEDIPQAITREYATDGGKRKARMLWIIRFEL